jgi:hypothetical protein
MLIRILPSGCKSERPEQAAIADAVKVIATDSGLPELLRLYALILHGVRPRRLRQPSHPIPRTACMEIKP